MTLHQVGSAQGDLVSTALQPGLPSQWTLEESPPALSWLRGCKNSSKATVFGCPFSLINKYRDFWTVCITEHPWGSGWGREALGEALGKDGRLTRRWQRSCWLRWSRICLQCRRPGFDPGVGKIPWRRD